MGLFAERKSRSAQGDESERDRRSIFGFHFSGDDAEEILNEASALPVVGQGTRLVVTANLDHIVLLRNNVELRTAYERAWRRTIDGAPLFLYAKFRGAGVPERVTGADLLPQLLERFDPKTHRPLFVVSDVHVREGLVRWAKSANFPDDSVDYVIPPFGFENDRAFGDSLVGRIKRHKTTHLIFGVGCPRSEIWIDKHSVELGDLYAFAVGAAVSFFVGTSIRAPLYFRKFGFEWLWRVKEEPRRLGKRYFINSWAFLAALRDDAFS